MSPVSNDRGSRHNPADGLMIKGTKLSSAPTQGIIGTALMPPRDDGTA